VNVAFQKRRARIGVLTLTLASLFLIVVLRLVVLVVFDGPRLNSLALSEHSGEVELAAVRGPIVDRNGAPLALSAETLSVYARPRELLAASSVMQRAELAATLDLSPAELEKALRKPSPFIWLKRRIAPERARAAEALGLDGTGALAEYKRFYPESNLAASVVGLAGMDGQGLSGVELQYDRLIRGAPVKLRIYHDALGHPILDSPLALKNAEPGGRVELTIDSGIQSLAENRLIDEVRESGARAGSAIVMDPFSGEVLALANVGAGAADIHDRLHDRAVQDAYEPGSTMKGLLSAIALTDRVVNTRQQFFCENGRYQLGRITIHDDSPHGWLGLGDIIEVSSNICAAKIALMLGTNRFYTGLTAFGLGRRTGIDLPGEADGLLRKPQSWRQIDLANHGFGQGVAVTPIQLAVAYSAIANGGMIIRPYVVRGVYRSDGTQILSHQPQLLRRAIPPDVAHQMNVLLRRVVNGAEGTAHRAQVADFIVAGKTGTAQMVNPANGTYYQNRHVSSFVGFLPADDPRLLILVVLYDVGHAHFGGLVAAPVFSEIATGAVRRLDIAAPRPPNYDTASMLPVSALRDAEALISSGASPADAAEMPPFAAGAAPAVPDFGGLSLRRALTLAHGRAFDIEVRGSGYVVAQDPAPGTRPDQPTIKLTLVPSLDAAARPRPVLALETPNRPHRGRR
jgi:cell division protein FtsI (penicillin-binding protein 3)